jgi:hypothetical protein
MVTPGWSVTLRDLLGAPIGEVDVEHINQLVTDKVRETDELEFKATLYPKDDEHRVELCKDVAGLRNHRGGVIILGVGDKDAVAGGCPEVDLSDAEERRMRQIVAAGTAPHAAFEIRRVPGKSATRGFYLLIAAPSSQRPHAVLVDEDLRYPRRDGTTTRYLSEAEVADLYRDRFRGERQQINRLQQVADEVEASIEKGGEDSLDVEVLETLAWLMVTLVPDSSSPATMSFVRQADVEQWARSEHVGNDLLGGFFEVPPQVQVGLERYVLLASGDIGRPPRFDCAYCYTDGVQTAAARIRLHTQLAPSENRLLLMGDLIWRAAAALRLAGRSAVRNSGAFGDAVVEARLIGPLMLLGRSHSSGLVEPYFRTPFVRGARSRHTLPVQALAGDPQDLLAGVRVVLADIVNAFGLAELPHIAADGALRTRYFPAGYEVNAIAERYGVQTTDEMVPE